MWFMPSPVWQSHYVCSRGVRPSVRLFVCYQSSWRDIFCKQVNRFQTSEPVSMQIEPVSMQIEQGFDLPRQQWSLLNHFCTEQWHCGACRRKWRLTDTDLCPCGETQMMSQIVESCPLTNEWRLISATLCGWRCCFVADQLWLMKCIQEEVEVQIGTGGLLVKGMKDQRLGSGGRSGSYSTKIGHKKISFVKICWELCLELF